MPVQKDNSQFALNCFTLHYDALRCVGYVAMHCIAMHCIAMHCITLHYIYITLHFNIVVGTYTMS